MNKYINIEANQLAVGNNQSDVVLNIAEDSAFSVINELNLNKLENTINVLQTSLDNYIHTKSSLKKIDILKIDVEGFEIMVLDGAKLLLSNKHSRPRLIMIEISINNLGEILPSSIKVIDLLISYDYIPKVLLNEKLVPFNIAIKWNSYNLFFIQ